MDVDIDKEGGSGATHANARNILDGSIEQLELIDVWRNINAETRAFTWRQLNPQHIFICLDFFLISETCLQFVTQCQINPGFRTEHSVVDLSFDFIQVQRGPGYYKLNTALLADKVYVAAMEKMDRYRVSTRI